MRVGRGNNVGGQTQLCWWADVIMLRNHYLTWFHIDQKFALFSHEGRSKDRFFKNTSHHNRRQTKTGLNAATHDLITNFFLEKFKKKMVDRHGGLKIYWNRKRIILRNRHEGKRGKEKVQKERWKRKRKVKQLGSQETQKFLACLRWELLKIIAGLNWSFHGGKIFKQKKKRLCKVK